MPQGGENITPAASQSLLNFSTNRTILSLPGAATLNSKVFFHLFLSISKVSLSSSRICAPQERWEHPPVTTHTGTSLAHGRERPAHDTCTGSASSARARPLFAPAPFIPSTKGQFITSITSHFFPGTTQILQVGGQVWMGADEHGSHTESFLQRERLPRELNTCHRKSRQPQ